MLDTSTFIHVVMIGRISLLCSLRKQLYFPEYVYRYELGVEAKEKTRYEAEKCVNENRIAIQQLTLSDLEKIAQLNPPRRIGLGEIACVMLAIRHAGGVLCDDRRAKNWLVPRLGEILWESIEEFLLSAAEDWHISEYQLDEFDQILLNNRYTCSFRLREEHLVRMHNKFLQT
ncbi:hypothetical protein [Planctomicrobium piriforme]|nr:hypothetical protein [Planctomicrobium piriforme]